MTPFFIVLAALMSLNLSAQHVLTEAELKEDLGIFRRSLETIYPGMYRYSDSVSVTRYLDEQINSAAGEQSTMDIYRRIVHICARMNDEHLIPTPPKWYYDSLKTSKHFFPFSIKMIEGRMYILRGFRLPEQLPPGSEILSINGRPVEELLSLLLRTIPSDGYIQTFNLRHLEDYSMTQNENLFDLNYPIFVEDVDTFRLEYLVPSNRKEIQTVSVKGLSFDQYEQFYRERREWTAPLQFKYLQNNVAYLRIYSFHSGHRDAFRQDFDKLYDSIFRKLQQNGTKSLILDLRNNEGGDNTGTRLLSYLLTRPYKLMDYLEEKFVGYPEVKEYLENGDDLFFIDSLVYKAPSGLYRLKDKYTATSPLFAVQRPSKNYFRGKLFVLINGASGSMAAVVASFLKGHGAAVFIGEECGGAMEGPTSMGYAELVLPNSSIRVEIPLTKSVHLLQYYKGRGVMPDYLISPKIENLLAGKDDELQFALKLALKNVR